MRDRRWSRLLAWLPLMAQGDDETAATSRGRRDPLVQPQARNARSLPSAVPAGGAADAAALEGRRRGVRSSLHDNDSYFLMRAFPSVEERQRSEDAFYGSDEWRKGPREAILAAIDSYTTDRHPRRRRDASTAFANGSDRATAGEELDADDDDLATALDDLLSSTATTSARCRPPTCSASRRSWPTTSSARIPTARSSIASTSSSRRRGRSRSRNLDVARRQRPAHGRLRDHARPDHVHDADGRPGSGRYTDVWARRNGRWLAVSAHVTRR